MRQWRPEEGNGEPLNFRDAGWWHRVDLRVGESDRFESTRRSPVQVTLDGGTFFMASIDDSSP